MPNSVYTINKGINKPIEFRGLKAQYIWHLAGSVVGSLLLFAILHLCKVNSYIGLVIVFGVGGFLVSRVYRMSKKYGQFGLMKKSARKGVPAALISRSRKVFTQLFSSHAGRSN